MAGSIILIGMPGAGKSTTGVLLAKALGYDFLDVDVKIATQQGRTLNQIIEADGIDAFLRIEEETGRTLQVEKTVVATGGSMALLDGAMENLTRLGTCVYLSLPVEELTRRMGETKHTRGIAAAPDVTIEQIFAHRQPYYERHADITIDCAGKTIEEVVQELVRCC